ncbi:MAG TPA: YtxH domain-containing protein [Blattabacteriaceae bacterium]|nr:YtxH domain-containing protein [Blattabacteriaceae bacterium]
MKGFLAGIGLGTAIGIWLAPESGQETRKKLMARGTELANRFEKQSNVAGDGENPGQQSAQRGMDAQAEAGSGDQTQSTQDPVAEVLNSASKTKLRSVPGIGDATARRIIESRPFESEEEVLENKVMPEKVLKNLKDTLVDPDEEVA